jgi:hypothetical protein
VVCFDSVNALIGPERLDMGPSIKIEVARGETVVEPDHPWNVTFLVHDLSEDNINASCMCVEFMKQDEEVIVATARMPRADNNTSGTGKMKFVLR